MKRILIIEDDRHIRNLYVKGFVKAGYQVDEAIDGEEALLKAAGQDYDMILLDIMLPKLNGIDVLKRLRETQTRTLKTPIFLISNLGQEDIVKEAFNIGADGYLIKAQLSPIQVVEEIEKYLMQANSPTA